MHLPIYLDYNATTPVDQRVLETMMPFFQQRFGNAASKTHRFGWEADDAVEIGRAQIAARIGARGADIVLTSGATESNNLALLGAAEAHRSRGRHLISSRVEHKAVLDPLHALGKRGYEITWLSPDSSGRIDSAQAIAALRKDTILVSLMLANNEVGTLNPIAAIGKETRSRGILLHTDAAQAIGKISVDVDSLGVDLMSLSAHKIYGPKGIGALYVRGRSPRARISPVVHGGGHERGLRPGTLPVPLVVGFGAACELADPNADASRLSQLATTLQEGLRKGLHEVRFNGHSDERLPGLVSATVPGIESEAFMLGLPEIAISSGSACTSAQPEPSHVLLGMGLSKRDANCTVRFSLGRFTTLDEIAFTVDRVTTVVRELAGGSRA